MLGRSVLNRMLWGILVLALSSCGGGSSKSGQTTISVIPEKPIVITADIKNSTGTVKAPWFKFKVKITNNSDTKLTIVALNIKVSAIVNGVTQTKNDAYDPSEYDFVTIDGTTCKYTTFGTINPGETKDLTATSPASACKAQIASFFSSGNPSDGRVGVLPPRYRVTLTPLGWFGPEDDPQDRYSRDIFISTQ